MLGLPPQAKETAMRKAEAPSTAEPTVVRGKYANLLKHGSNVVMLDPVLLPHFPDCFLHG